MAKKLRFLVVAAAVALFSTSALAQDAQSEERVSADGSYEFHPSWGIGLQYALTLTDMANWNDYLLVPARQNYFNVDFNASHELYVEFTAVEGFRMSFFGGYQSLYITDTGFNYAFGGIEPAFSVRRSFYEFAVGIGAAYGYSWLDSKTNDMDGHGLFLRPFVEARFYMGDVFALYLRLAFSYYKEFGDVANKYAKLRDLNNEINEDKLSYAGPTVAVGFRFGSYPTPVVSVGDTDGDGVLDDVDACPNVAGQPEFFGCPNPDTDGDGVCDAWVSEAGASDAFESLCKGLDKCPDAAGPAELEGCPNPDSDGDGICDTWVSEKGLSDYYANVCKGSDQCANETEDVDGFQDEDGCPDPDNDGDGICDPWVLEQGLAAKYVNVCSARDLCPDDKGEAEFNGCPNPDPDKDNFCNAWVYDKKLESYFPQCTKGLDKCPENAGKANGCVDKTVTIVAPPVHEKIEISGKIFFDTGKATIKRDSDPLLEEVAQILKSRSNVKKVEIQGHTDATGNAKKNLKLSESRAKSVRDRLVKLGVDRKRLSYKGYGSTQMLIPLEPGQSKETAEQAAANRRVEFVILEQD